MSDHNEEEDERRLDRCVRKYKTIVKQFDELIEMMSSRTKLPKRRATSSSGGSSGTITPAGSRQTDNKDVFVQTILRFLQELRADPTTDPDISTPQNQE